MKYLLTILSLTAFVLSFGQKAYQIDQTYWVYEKPENYIFREDNFSEIISKGEEFLKENVENICPDPKDEKLLLTIAKSNDSDLNILISSFSENSNIAKFTMDGYIDRLIQTYYDQFDKHGTPVDIEKEKTSIDSVDFYKLTIIVHNPITEYKSIQYIGEIDEKEVNFTMVTDNESDEKLIEDSIKQSFFK